MTIAFDKRDFHLDGALRSGQPEEHAFTHIGLYLAWIVRNDLFNPEFMQDVWLAALMAGEMAGSDLADAIDGKLTSDLMSAEGAAFSAARYDAYMREYPDVFAAEGDFGVEETSESYARIAPVIDRMYAEWEAAGRPQPDTSASDEPPTDDVHGPGLEDLRALAEAEGWEVTEVTLTPAPDQMPHRAPELEELIPRDISEPAVVTSSMHAGEWGDALLLRALKRLHIDPKVALVVNGMGGAEDGVITATLYAVPGVGADDLEREFAWALDSAPRTGWEVRDVSGKRVHWEASPWFHFAFWTLDGLVVQASAQDAERLERLVGGLP